MGQVAPVRLDLCEPLTPVCFPRIVEGKLVSQRMNRSSDQTYVYIHIYIYMYMYIYIYVCMSVSIPVTIHIYIHTHVHAHVHRSWEELAIRSRVYCLLIETLGKIWPRLLPLWVRCGGVQPGAEPRAGFRV